MNWHKAKRAIEKGLSPQISDYNAVSDIQWAMYQAISQLDRVQAYSGMGNRSASASFHDKRLPLVWERES